MPRGNQNLFVPLAPGAIVVVRCRAAMAAALWLFAASTSAVPAAPAALSRVSTSIGKLAISEVQEHVSNAFGSDSTGTRIWDAGRLLSDVLSERDLSGQRVLECGSGTGVGGLTAASAGAASVVLTDGAAATLPLLEENVAANGLVDRVQTCRLRWGHEDDMHEARLLGPFDLIIGSDLLYAPESFPDLLETLTALCTPDVTEVLLTYPTRYTERTFLEAAEEHGFEQSKWEEEVEPALWATSLVLRS